MLTAAVGPSRGPTLVLHGHLDVVPARAEQFSPRIEGDRLYGRGAYDMKGGVAAMMCALRAAKRPYGPDSTAPDDYAAEAGDPGIEPLPATAEEEADEEEAGRR